MPLLYSQIPLYTSGMVSAQRFQMCRDGRRVLFDLGEQDGFRKKIFTIIDGEFKEGFVNGSRMNTPVRLLDCFLPTPHEAYAIVVDCGEYRVPSINIPITPVPITFMDGKKSIVKFSASVTASISAKDPEGLAYDFAQGIVISPQELAAAVLKKELLKALTREIPEMMHNQSPANILNSVDFLALSLSDIATSETEKVLSWCRVNTCEVSIRVENIDSIIADSNAAYELNISIKRALVDAIITNFGVSPLPAEVSAVIKAFVQANPGITANDLQNFCQGLSGIWSRAGSSQLISAINQLGLTSGGI